MAQLVTVASQGNEWYTGIAARDTANTLKYVHLVIQIIYHMVQAVGWSSERCGCRIKGQVNASMHFDSSSTSNGPFGRFDYRG